MSEKSIGFNYNEDEISAISEEYVAADAENRRIRALFRSVFGTDAGKEVLEVIRRDICCVGMSCFDENPVNMARRAGRQEAAFAIDEILNLAEKEEKEDMSDDV